MALDRLAQPCCIETATARVIRFKRDDRVVAPTANWSSHLKYDRNGMPDVITGKRYGFKHKLAPVRPSTRDSGVLVHHAGFTV